MNTTAPHHFLSLLRILKFICQNSLDLTTHQADFWGPMFWFLWGGTTAPVYGFSFACRPWPVNCMKFLSLEITPTITLRRHKVVGGIDLIFMALGCPHIGSGRYLDEVFAVACGWASSWRPEYSQQESIHFNVLWYSRQLFFNPFPSPVIEFLPQYSGCWGRETSFSNSILHTWGSWALTHHFPFSFPSWELSRLIHPCFLPPWGRLSTGRVSLTFSVHPNSYFLLFQCSTRIPPQEFWTSTKALSSLGVCLSQNFLTLAKRGARVGSLTSPSCIAMLRCICLLQMYRFARILSNPLAYVSRYHNLHRGTFIHGWILKFSC